MHRLEASKKIQYRNIRELKPLIPGYSSDGGTKLDRFRFRIQICLYPMMLPNLIVLVRVLLHSCCHFAACA